MPTNFDYIGTSLCLGNDSYEFTRKNVRFNGRVLTKFDMCLRISSLCREYNLSAITLSAKKMSYSQLCDILFTYVENAIYCHLK